jgi:serine O-acetyltransferase
LKSFLALDFARAANRTGAQRLVLVVFRLGQFVQKRERRGPLYLLWRTADAIWLRLLCGVELPPKLHIGPGLAIPHCARGIVMHENVVIGSNCMIFHRTTFGADDHRDAPELGDDVFVGTGACVLGPIRVGAGARIGANAVVIEDVPERATVGGVPAKVIRER